MNPIRHAFLRLPTRLAVLGALLAALTIAGPAQAQSRDSFKIAWSIYVGWMPWGYGAASGIVAKWADKYEIDIEVVQINDYIESINLYTAGGFDGVTVTNMDALTIPAAGGVDTTALIVGDFSDGNDGLVLKGTDQLTDVRGKNVHLVELSVSHYLLARALESAGMSERDVRIVNTSDADIVGAFGSSDVEAVVTWNPQLGEIRARDDANIVFDSSQIPGEIMDLLVVNTDVLEANPALGKALTGAWYEIMDVMRGDDEAGRAARAAMGEAGGTDLAGYEAQLASTRMFYDAAAAVEFVTGSGPMETMDKVRQFAFEHGLLGERAPSPDFVGIEFTDGSILGSADNVRFRFNAEYMQMAADGEL
ncbi:MAG TPA: putative urea ABC transporter substrate-binding protein [Thioalkalivibrio sp.]|nr:putative urea ABC transporter substrate-binding protein [Thioalkalivibrio sp.]